MNKYVEMLNWHIFKLHQALFWEKKSHIYQKIYTFICSIHDCVPLRRCVLHCNRIWWSKLFVWEFRWFFFVNWCEDFIIIYFISIFIIHCILGMFWEMTAFTNMYNLIYQVLYKYTMFTDMLSIIFRIFVCYWKLIC